MWKQISKLIKRGGTSVRPVRGDIKAGFKLRYTYFKELISSNDEVLGIISDLEEKLGGHHVFGMAYIRSAATRSAFHAFRMVKNLDIISGHKYSALYTALENTNKNIKAELNRKATVGVSDFILPYSAVTREMVDIVGGKNANLGEVKNKVGLDIPDGFVITTYAYRYFLQQNDLQDEINKRSTQLDLSDSKNIVEASEEVQRLIITASVPPKLEAAIVDAYDELARRLGYTPRISMRSSAIGEDSEISYAGQYLSALNVAREKVILNYKYVIASLYTPRAIFYRLNKGLREEDTAMSVGCLEMVDATVSGIAYSRHPYSPIEDNIFINAVWGLGPYAVDGTVQPDAYILSKDEDFRIIESRTPPKSVRLTSDPAAGGVIEKPVPPEMQNQPCLQEKDIKVLAKAVVDLENHFHSAQDVEWALTEKRKLLILQSRPLRISTYEKSGLKDLYQKIPGYPVLVENGSIAYPGVGHGSAYHIHRDEDMANFPEGGIIITRDCSPKLVSLMGTAKAIVTDSGGITGHLASLAREFKVPTIVGTCIGTQQIPAGAEITVDAYTGRVYQGRLEELLGLERVHETYMKDTPVYKTLESVCKYITPLHLTDPADHGFAAQFCTSIHDIIRFVHEKSFPEMFKISDVLTDEEEAAIHLEADLPINLYIIDLGDGLAAKGIQERKHVREEDLTCLPLIAFLRGMTHKEIKWREPRAINLSGLMSVLRRQMIEGRNLGRRLGDKSYAIISENYMNFNSRIGYHFCTVDSYCGTRPNENYISFRFKGGAADDERRARRARAMGIILERLGFTVNIKGDLINARIKKYEKEIMEEKLDMLGRLNQFTRQVDMLMSNDSSVGWLVTAFTEGNYNLERDFRKEASAGLK